MFWTPRLCRICATVGELTYAMFSQTSSDIEIKFKKCFQLDVYKDDFKPKEVCSICIDKLNDFCMFFDLCVASNNKFESILYQTNRSEVQDNWQNRIEYKMPTDVFLPNENGVIVKPDDIVLITQYKNDILNIERDVICENNININEALETFEQTQNQTVLRHSSEFYKNVEMDCNLDEFNFNYNQRKKTDFNNDNYNSFSEPFTEKINYSETPPQEAAVNIDTEFVSNDKEPLDVSNQDKKKPFACSECDKSFMRKLTLKAHMSSHTNIKPYRCDVCNKSFPLRWALTCHKRIHSKVFECIHCAKSFPAASKLERHIRIHTNERPFKCEVDGCNKTFSDKRNLVGHQVTHSKDRTFHCDICKKWYKTKSQLKDHQMAHSNLSFSCDICSKSFKWKTNLLVHVKKHSDFNCKKCKIDFRNRSMFLMHKEECLS